MKYYCKDCGCEMTINRSFCSKSCAISYRNWEKVQNGTHNLLSKNGGSELAVKSNNDRVANGTHPFLPGNMSKESLELKNEGIRLARIKEASEGNHPWQSLSSRINNEYSRSLSVAESRNLTEICLYFSDCEVPDHFKLGWTDNIENREFDSRTHKISNLEIMKIDNYENIIELEYLIKSKFCKEEIFKSLRSSEIFPNEFKIQIQKFIENYK